MYAVFFFFALFLPPSTDPTYINILTNSNTDLYIFWLWVTCIKSSVETNLLSHSRIKVPANEDTLLRTHCWCFLGCANWETFVVDTKCFWTKSEIFFVSWTQNLCLRVRANRETFVSETMCPQQCVRNNVSSFARAFRIIVLTCPVNINVMLHTCKKSSVEIMCAAKSHKSQCCGANIISNEIFAPFQFVLVLCKDSRVPPLNLYWDISIAEDLYCLTL